MNQDTADDGARRWPAKLRVALLLVGILLGAVAAPWVLGQVVTNEYQIGENATYVAPDGLSIEAGEDITTNRQHPFSNATTVDFGPEVAFHADGEAHARVSGLEDQWLVLDDLDASSTELRVRPEDQSDLNVAGAASRLELNSIALDDGQADLRVTTNGETTLDVWDLPANTVILAVDADTGDLIETVETDGDGSGTFTVSSTRDVEFVSETTVPTITNTQPADGAVLEDYETNLSADVTDPDFAETWGDNVTVVFHDADDGTEIHNETIGANGTVTTTWSGLDMGTNTWNVTAEDEYGNTVSAGPFTVETPNQLEIRDEETLELVNDSDANVTVRFFGAGGDISVSRSTTDGVVTLTGLPSDQRLFVQTDANGYHPRTTVIESITEQQSAYLVDENTTVVQNTFVLDDQTGAFQSRNTILLIEGLIDVGGDDEEYRVIAGDEFGSDARVQTRLIADERYQITVLNRDGDRRSLGSYTAASSGTVTLSIGEVQWGTPEEDGYTFDVEKIDGGSTIELQYNSSEPAADELTVRVVERYDDSAVLYENTVTDTQSWRATIPLNETEQGVAYRVEYTLDRGGETTQGSMLVSGDTSVSTSLPTVWMTGFAMIAIVVVSALFTGRMASFGGIATVSVAGLLMIIGWAPIPTGAWFVAAFIALGGYVRAHEGATP